ncbi:MULTISPECIES: 3'-5' exoribonuclease [unclassified Beijerinckia]|uniref:3'-5' exoribonuclease domain-containing protein n=1 Tax=unclassified Beijerinckia TaxID=2638183 RepID=UPI000895F972|nr:MULTISPECIES: 3'-5' exoribonuclease [unclassified Beijerinckia]MDH7796463.1 hypothetical protein [Beijerinckia sp. GAS462]SEC46162.1 protein of unknown function [Beijerinckia sp. 28-YEA-48]
MTNLVYPDIMFDCETTGIDPSHSWMLQAAAVRFNVETGEVDADDMFCRSLAPNVPNRFWDESTRQWWGRQKPEILEAILARSEDPALVMQDLFNWIAKTPTNRPIRFWAKPISFDWGFMDSYFRQFMIQNPLRYYNAVDVRSYITGRGHTEPLEWEQQFEFVGEAHNAIFDVLHQIKLVTNA